MNQYVKKAGKDQANYVEIALKGETKNSKWILDSGCTNHMTGDAKKLSDISKE